MQSCKLHSSHCLGSIMHKVLDVGKEAAIWIVALNEPQPKEKTKTRKHQPGNTLLSCPKHVKRSEHF